MCLALQGGGALGAFSWGVLDALLAEGVPIEAVSGASAGAVNAVVLADGLLRGAPDQARARLEAFWREVSNAYVPAPQALTLALQSAPLQPSPAWLNPFGWNPLHDLLRKEIDFDRLRRESPVQLFIAATRVRDGRARVFPTPEVSLEAVLASACLPQFHEAVEISGEAYWDGGYSANPPLLEMVCATRAKEVLTVELTTPGPPPTETRGREIAHRLRDFALTAPLQRELDALSHLQHICETDPGAGSKFAKRLRGLQVRRLSAGFDGGSRPDALDASWTNLRALADQGAAAGAGCLAATTAQGAGRPTL